MRCHRLIIEMMKYMQVIKRILYVILIEGYVADEIITSAAGTRVRVGNTDAEGRMAMADSLHYMKLKVNKG